MPLLASYVKTEGDKTTVGSILIKDEREFLALNPNTIILHSMAMDEKDCEKFVVLRERLSTPRPVSLVTAPLVPSSDKRKTGRPKKG